MAFPQVQRPKPQTSTLQSTKSLHLLREKHCFGPSANPPHLATFLQPSRTPALLPRILQRVEILALAILNLQKRPEHGALTILASKSLSRHSLVQICAPTLPVRNDFGFRIALAPQRGTNFGGAQLPKVLRTCSMVPFFSRKPFSRHSVVQILRSSTSKSAPMPSVFNDFGLRIAVAPQRGANFGGMILRTTSLLGLAFASLRSHKTMEKHSVSRNPYPLKSLMSRICAVKYLCCQTSMLHDLAATFSIVRS